jgi:hypothetical protein
MVEEDVIIGCYKISTVLLVAAESVILKFAGVLVEACRYRTTSRNKQLVT